MSLFSRDLVHRLHRRVHVETEQHPRWRTEARAARKSAWRLKRQNYRFVVPLLAIGLAASNAGALLAMPVVFVWSATLMFARATEIQHLFFAHAESAPFYQFPVTERFVFRHAARRLCRSSLWLIVDVLFFLATVAIRIKPPEAIGESLLLAAAAAVGVWAAVLCGAITLVWIRPGFPFGIISGFAFSFGWIGLWVASKVKLLSPESIRAGYESARWCLPPGWVCILFQPWLESGRSMSAAAFILLAGLAAATVMAVLHLAGAFTFWQIRAEPETSGEILPEVPVSRVSDVEDVIASRSFLAARDWTGGGFIERTASRLLTPRECRVMDLAQPWAPGWTRRFPYACVLIVAAPFFAWCMRGVGSEPGWILALGSLAGLAMISPLAGGHWAVFTLFPIANRATALCNLWPVGIREVRNCVLKLNLVRYLFALPLWLIAGGAAAGILGDRVLWGVAVAGKCWLLALALQPFFLAFKYSASTNDTSSGCLFVIGLLALTLTVVAVALIAAVLGFDADKSVWWLMACTALAVLSWLFEVAYRRAWRAQQFDLLSKNGADAWD